jgi:hypothetical protein
MATGARGATRARENRTKLSTTVAPENYRYLEALIEAGRAQNLAEAVDLTIRRSRKAENRQRLAAATAAYFENLSPEALEEERALGRALSNAAAGIDIDRG